MSDSFDERDYWYKKYVEETTKLKKIEAELYDLNQRKKLLKSNQQRYRKKYLDCVTNSPIEEVI